MVSEHLGPITYIFYDHTTG